MKAWRLVLLPFLSLFAAFILEGIITAYFNGVLYTGIGYVAPRLTLILLIMFAFYLSPNHMYILSIIIGFLYDSYFTSYLGIYMASFCLISYIVMELKDLFKNSLLTYGLVGILMITLLELIVYWVFRVIGVTNAGVSMFLANRLGVTLLFNGILIFVLSPLLEKFSLYILSERLSNYRQF